MCGVDLGITLDTCIRCKTDTLYDGYDKIEDREHYIKGVGQLCKKCYTEYKREDA